MELPPMGEVHDCIIEKKEYAPLWRGVLSYKFLQMLHVCNRRFMRGWAFWRRLYLIPYRLAGFPKPWIEVQCLVGVPTSKTLSNNALR